jgi:hypothetical protein
MTKRLESNTFFQCERFPKVSRRTFTRRPVAPCWIAHSHCFSAAPKRGARNYGRRTGRFVGWSGLARSKNPKHRGGTHASNADANEANARTRCAPEPWEGVCRSPPVLMDGRGAGEPCESHHNAWNIPCWRDHHNGARAKSRQLLSSRRASGPLTLCKAIHIEYAKRLSREPRGAHYEPRLGRRCAPYPLVTNA